MIQYFRQASSPTESHLVLLDRHTKSKREIQNYLDYCKASDLVINLIMHRPGQEVFLESIKLGIVLLDEGNEVVQVVYSNELKDIFCNDVFSTFSNLSIADS